MNSITPAELHKRLSLHEDIVLIDVREPWEHEIFNIGGTLIPLNSLMENIEKIETERPVVIYCRKGIRSQIAIQRLQLKYDFTNLMNLSGGMNAWQQESGNW